MQSYVSITRFSQIFSLLVSDLNRRQTSAKLEPDRHIPPLNQTVIYHLLAPNRLTMLKTGATPAFGFVLKPDLYYIK